MRIGIDLQTVIVRPTGVGRYVSSLVRALAGLAGEERYRLFYFDFKRRGSALGVADPRFEERPIRCVPGRVYHALAHALGAPDISLLAGRCDLYHFPNFIIPPCRRGKAVVTVHDLSFVRFPQYAEEGNLRRLRRRFDETLRRADAVITVSDFSRRELAELCGVPPEKVAVTRHGASIRPPTPPARPAAFPYFLFVGTVEPRKNLETLLDAWRILKGREGARWTHRLLVVGRHGWRCTPAEEQARARGVEAGVTVLDYVRDDELPGLYGSAEALVFPSRYEGFGLPPLEAMACGTPVIASTAPAIPEVVGDAALLCDPDDAAGFAEAMRRVRDDPALRADLSMRGRARAAQFTWERTAAETLALYRRLFR
jgi:glycosyltransferase involved in cell wall biosynthesis